MVDRTWLLRAVGTLTLAAGLCVPFTGVARAQQSAAGLCMGKVHVSPNPVHVGAWLTVKGTGFSCKEPTGAMFPTAAVIIFLPNYGFVIYTAHVSHGGYIVHVRFPAKLTNASAIMGKPAISVATHPGIYYIDIRLMDVAMDTAQAQARFVVLR
jgi:hypothetical protein